MIRLSEVVVPEPASRVCVLTLGAGKTGQELLAVSGPVLEEYAKRVGADYRVLVPPVPGPYPIIWKLATGRYLQVYDRVVFLDADVVLSPDCPNLFEVVPADRLALHDDWPILEDYDWIKAEYTTLAAETGYELDTPETCLNTGVVVASRCHAAAFEPPGAGRPLTVTHTLEQALVNLNVKRHGMRVHRLPRELSWLWLADKNFQHTGGVKVWHFANCPQAARLAFMRKLVANPDALRRKAPKNKDGPGTELKALLASVGVTEEGGCGCGSKAAQMDRWGVEGCKARRADIVSWLREASAQTGVWSKLVAAALGLKTGLAFSINPLNPLPGIVDEAIRRAEEKLAGVRGT